MSLLHLAAVAAVALHIAALIYITRRWHADWSGDQAGSGVQKQHQGSPPRVGGLAVLSGLVAGLVMADGQMGPVADDTARLLALLLVCSIPAAGLGLLEDISKKIAPRVRMLGAAASGALAIWLLDATIHRVDIIGIDLLMPYAPFAAAVTLLMVCGFTNAMNIVDGLNGLAGGLALVMLACTAAVAYQLGDQPLLQISLLLGASIVGFLCINFPRGMIFLGDGGAYLIGFLLVELWILLCIRHPTLTPWFVVAVAFHPTMETIFSIYRRKLVRRRRQAAMAADRLHLHSLVYRRRTLLAVMFRRAAPADRTWRANSAAAVLVVLFGSVPGLLAIIQPQSVPWNLAVVLAAVAAYLVWFARLGRLGRLRGRVANRPRRVAPSVDPAKI